MIRDFSGLRLPVLRLEFFGLSLIKTDLKRLFVTVIDHTTGPEHQLLFFEDAKKQVSGPMGVFEFP